MHQLQLTITDLVVLIHDTHHPITGYLYYEQQRPAAKLRTTRTSGAIALPKFLRYFERVLAKSGGPYLLGRRLSYVDLSLFQIVEGLRYAFPKRMKRFEKKVPRVIALHDRVAKRPRIAAYLALQAADRLQPVGHLPLFQGAGWVGRRADPWPRAHRGLAACPLLAACFFPRVAALAPSLPPLAAAPGARRPLLSAPFHAFAAARRDDVEVVVRP